MTKKKKINNGVIRNNGMAHILFLLHIDFYAVD